MLNIVIPMAGAGSRFAQAGYIDPKPLIPVHGIPMIRLVIDNLTPSQPHRFIFICQAAHVERYQLREKLAAWAPESIILEVNGVTEGAACTVLAAKAYINNADPLMIANSDQFIDMDVNDYLQAMERSPLDGLIMTMRAEDPKWSFVQVNAHGLVTQLAEKVVISHEATVGIYNFLHGCNFVKAAEKMIAENIRVNHEFYVGPVYNTLIAQGCAIGVYNVGQEGAGMYGLGTPKDLEAFLPVQKFQHYCEHLV